MKCQQRSRHDPITIYSQYATPEYTLLQLIEHDTISIQHRHLTYLAILLIAEVDINQYHRRQDQGILCTYLYIAIKIKIKVM